MTTPIYLHPPGLVCALGSGLPRVREALWHAAGPGGLVQTERYSPGRSLPLGEVQAALPSLDHAAPQFRVRNNAIALLALEGIRPAVEAAINRFGPSRVAVVVGTSTSGLLRAAGDGLSSLAAFPGRALGAHGPAHVISTACSSGAKALASAARLLKAGMADAVVAGGVDALERAFTIAGFSALESVSATRCNPLSLNRQGINIGEGAACSC
jgi:3-oxoacyl-[acyl-carrier-protein] synthase-1